MFDTLKDAQLRAKVHVLILALEVLLPFALYASLQAGNTGLALVSSGLLALGLLVLVVLP